jgi:predicted ATP-dependent endonuclease of OLD family
MLSKLRLTNFRAFKDFTIHFKGSAYLVGPNNAGKTTVLTSIRIASALLRLAYQRKADLRVYDEGVLVFAYPINLSDYPALMESIHHEFTDEESRLELSWNNGSRLIAVWPASDENEPFFYLRLKGKEVKQPQSINKVREHFKQLGIVPVLTPLEHNEILLTDKYVQNNISSRLSSRHFRNQLRLLGQNNEFDALLDFIREWLPDFTL